MEVGAGGRTGMGRGGGQRSDDDCACCSMSSTACARRAGSGRREGGGGRAAMAGGAQRARARLAYVTDVIHRDELRPAKELGRKRTPPMAVFTFDHPVDALHESVRRHVAT